MMNEKLRTLKVVHLWAFVLAAVIGCDHALEAEPTIDGFVLDREGNIIDEYEIAAKPGDLVEGDYPWTTSQTHSSGGYFYPTEPIFERISDESGRFSIGVYDECREATVFIRLESGEVYARRVSMDTEALIGDVEIRIGSYNCVLLTDDFKPDQEPHVSTQ
mgnify:CR=1 FL=1